MFLVISGNVGSDPKSLMIASRYTEIYDSRGNQVLKEVDQVPNLKNEHNDH